MSLQKVKYTPTLLKRQYFQLDSSEEENKNRDQETLQSTGSEIHCDGDKIFSDTFLSKDIGKHVCLIVFIFIHRHRLIGNNLVIILD